MAAAASSSSGSLDKNKKYDRQLRLWGDHGQSALESSKVCLVNATATGCEILKNLILPGVGSFVIVDGQKVAGEDVGNNFFLEKESIGKSRAKTATELLIELNEDVSGDFVEESVDVLMSTNPHFFEQFTVVIATNISESSLISLAELLWNVDIPLVLCRSYGFIGYLRLVVKEHTVTESHPDSVHDDLRLDRPLPEFVAFCDSLNLNTMSKKDHSHTPWLVLMYKFLNEWRQTRGQNPANYKEKQEFKEFLRKGICKNEEGVPEEEENFDEAIKNVNTALLPTRIPSAVLDILNDRSCTNLTAEAKPFWIMAHALKHFVENEGQGALPVRGTLPDMTSDSERYIILQRIYQRAAERDATTVEHRVQCLLQQLSLDEPLDPRQYSHKQAQDVITTSKVKLFCKYASFLRLIRTRSIAEEYNFETAQSSQIAMHLEDTENNDFVFYTLLRAVDRFHAEYNRYPGYYTSTVETDVPKLKACLNKLLQDWGLEPLVKDDFVHEMCCYGGSELHAIASLMGGIAAQEVIKLITHQFIPINNTYIYNGMKQTSMTVQL